MKNYYLLQRKKNPKIHTAKLVKLLEYLKQVKKIPSLHKFVNTRQGSEHNCKHINIDFK